MWTSAALHSHLFDKMRLSRVFCDQNYIASLVHSYLNILLHYWCLVCAVLSLLSSLFINPQTWHYSSLHALTCHSFTPECLVPFFLSSGLSWHCVQGQGQARPAGRYRWVPGWGDRASSWRVGPGHQDRASQNPPLLWQKVYKHV